METEVLYMLTKMTYTQNQIGLKATDSCQRYSIFFPYFVSTSILCTNCRIKLDYKIFESSNISILLSCLPLEEASHKYFPFYSYPVTLEGWKNHKYR